MKEAYSGSTIHFATRSRNPRAGAERKGSKSPLEISEKFNRGTGYFSDR
jgi:hypothetical protein